MLPHLPPKPLPKPLPKPPPFLKICCIASVQEAQLAIAAGANALGLVSAMPSGPGVITDADIANIAAWVRQQHPHVQSFLLTARQSAQAITQQHQVCQTTALQLVDAVPVAALRQLRTRLPGVRLVQVVHVVDAGSLAQALHVAPWVDMLLLDSGNPGLAVKELGGTGRTHNWGLSQQIVQAVGAAHAQRVPVLLAGGLNASNARAALAQVQPQGLDICSGVRTAGRLDATKLAEFVAQIQIAI